MRCVGRDGGLDRGIGKGPNKGLDKSLDKDFDSGLDDGLTCVEALVEKRLNSHTAAPVRGSTMHTWGKARTP